MAIQLNILGYHVFVSTNNDTIASQLKMDFEHFEKPELLKINHLSIDCQLVEEITTSILPKNLKPLFQRQNSITYEQNGVRYNDYYGKVISRFNAKKNEALIIGRDKDKLYEVLYLFILSRSGKYLDLKGIHKIHAFSIVHKGKGLVCMQPMRGGKSTLFTELLNNYDVEIGSDDTPLIDQYGLLAPFPLRVSLDELPTNIDLDSEKYYLMNREFYKSKYSISLSAFNKKIATNCINFVFVEAHRSTHDEPLLVPMTKIRLFKRLFHHMVIGFGLPLIFEYFWESGTNDFYKKTTIFYKRFSSALKLSLSKKGYDLYMSKDSKRNAKVLMDLLK